MKFEIKQTDSSNIQQSLEAIVSFIKSRYSEGLKNATVYITLENTRTKMDEYFVNGTEIIKGTKTVFDSDQFALVEKLKAEVGRYKHEYYERIQEIKRQIGHDNIYIDDRRRSKELREKRKKTRESHKSELAETQRCFNDILMPFDVDAAKLSFSRENGETVLVAHNDKCEFIIKKTQKGFSEAAFKHDN